MQTLNVCAVSVKLILESAGFEIRGRRANCAFCSGSGRLTVSFTENGLWYCHRCGRGGHVRSLGHGLGIRLPQPKPRLADIPKSQFREWLSQKMAAMSMQEWELYRRVRWAILCLQFYPDHQLAWSILAEWHEAERGFSEFWQLATERYGRLLLYKTWRRYGIAR